MQTTTLARRVGRASFARVATLVSVVVAGGAIGAAPACHRTKVQSGLTGVSLTVRYNAALSLTALKISGKRGSVAGDAAFDPGTLTNATAQLNTGKETATILVNPGLARMTIVLRVDGMVGGVVAGSGAQVVVVREAELVPAEVTLGTPPVCGDTVVAASLEQCDDGNVANGDGCSSDCLVEAPVACGPETCPGGCCQDGMCEPRALGTCGTGGAACTSCSAIRADTCSEVGGCQCGSGAPCAGGQICLKGVCTCDASSCPDGCCLNGACVKPVLPPAVPSGCGLGGNKCSVCDPTKADRCDGSGACACGTGSACVAGQQCENGRCACNATSCASGCCQGNVCSVRSLTTCGSAGATCAMCDLRSDSCSSLGACRCGGGPVCPTGQRCLGGTCVCDGTSCANGCCQQGLCLEGDTADSCGVAGSRCDACPVGQTCSNGRCSGCTSPGCNGCCSGATCNPPALATCGIGANLCVGCDVRRADGCTAGDCSCGGGPQCPSGTRCMDGACVCRPNSCPSGCCLGGSCYPPALNVCGSAGGICTDCTMITADKCTTSGSCGCGAGPACAARQHCLAGTCVCDATSCPNGCCEGNVCRSPTTPATCGSGAAVCHDCGIKADQCTATGACRCGAGAACGEGQRCVDSKCVCDGASCANGCCSGAICVVGTDPAMCGTGGAKCQDCGAGPCMSGVCSTCTAANCPDGCCSGTTCIPSTLQTCGASGAACVSCDPSRANGCSAGVCTCGGQPACGAGKRCVGGACVCNALSCPDGCCSNNVCQVPAAGACGIGGASCMACLAQTADTCDATTGRCQCGTKSACGAGTVCLGGSCLCNAESCPRGCCANGVCMAPPPKDTCGVNGGTCVACDATTADGCSEAGTCTCGTDPQCDTGSHCAGGSCVADP